MTESDLKWKDRIVKTARTSRDLDSALWVSSKILTDYKEALRRTIQKAIDAMDEEEIDEIEGGMISAYNDVLELIDTILPEE